MHISAYINLYIMAHLPLCIFQLITQIFAYSMHNYVYFSKCLFVHNTLHSLHTYAYFLCNTSFFTRPGARAGARFTWHAPISVFMGNKLWQLFLWSGIGMEQSGEWGLKNLHCGPLLSSIISNSRKNKGQALFVTFAPRLDNSYNHAHMPGPHMYSKIVEVIYSCQEFKFIKILSAWDGHWPLTTSKK